MAANQPNLLPKPDLLDDLAARFILSLPSTELESFERLLFSVEQAWWHYEDHTRQKNPALRSLSLKEFTGLMFEKCPGLEPFRGSLEEIYQAFNAYKRTVPVRGAIILDPTMEKCLLVRGFKRDAGWGFPRGKLSANETDSQCAIREVIEETGYDVGPKLNEDDFIELNIGDQATKLFIICGVEESTPFAPHVRGEIGAFGWHVVSHLPSTWEQGKQLFVNEQGSRHKFFNVWPYMKPLRTWINGFMKSTGGGGNSRRDREKNSGSMPGESFRKFKFDRQHIMQNLTTPLVEAS